MSKLSIIRTAEYRELQKLELNGAILDVGGSKTSQYHLIIKGEHTFDVVNINEKCQPDFNFDIEKPFPLDSEKYDHAVCMNVLEHVFEFENVFSETLRCIKPGGQFVIATPFMHHIHGSPDDYLRYTPSAYRRLSEKYNCELVSVTPLGGGLFSLIFQSISLGIPSSSIFKITKLFFVSLDKMCNKVIPKYQKLTEALPLGYFVVFKK